MKTQRLFFLYCIIACSLIQPLNITKARCLFQKNTFSINSFSIPVGININPDSFSSSFIKGSAALVWYTPMNQSVIWGPGGYYDSDIPSVSTCTQISKGVSCNAIWNFYQNLSLSCSLQIPIVHEMVYKKSIKVNSKGFSSQTLEFQWFPGKIRAIVSVISPIQKKVFFEFGVKYIDEKNTSFEKNISLHFVIRINFTKFMD